MDPITVSVATAALTSLATKGADAPAKTLNLLWQATFGRWDEKLKQTVEANIRRYAKDIDDEVSKIPNDSINNNPDISVIGPALEASKYYVEKTDVRKMFAKLIAAEFDARSSDKVHIAFVEIIKQMSANDAKLLKILPKVGPLAEFRLYGNDRKSYTSLGKDIIYIPGLIETNFENNAISINNLSRLGIVELSHISSLVDKTIYKAYEVFDEYKQGTKIVQEHPDNYSSMEVSSGLFSITPFGDVFKKICL
ncbi:MAG: DUF4393 domain-containing protein [Megasphaera sp.]|uniref:DUF4393 domain-containing protein n=1 Tax=Megasphaera sp. TaxID=2023260 RepID=UPI0025C43705|nr:DUF4393 domain-containing protein [Megasphaera sp.]MCI7600797.1 DUF4393 domain-containing protein [Megasphaera sp.]